MKANPPKAKRYLIFVLLLAAGAVGLPFVLAGCGDSDGSGPIVLEPEEVTEYQGQDLSSISDFRENSIKGPQYVDVETYALEVTGMVGAPGTYTYDEVVNGFQRYEKVVTLNCVEGWSVTILWEGVLVEDLIAGSSPSPDAKVIIFHAYDGYTTSHDLDYIRENDILMADQMNGVVIPPERGFPFQLVAESKWGYKWIKWITRIELSDDEDYQGYWERVGYSNEGNLDESIFSQKNGKPNRLSPR